MMTASSTEASPSPKVTGAKTPATPRSSKGRPSASTNGSKPGTPRRPGEGNFDPHPPRRRGRPPGSKTLNLETAEKIAQLISSGAFVKDAVALAGVNLRTYYEWMQLGEGTHPTRKGSANHRRFAEIVNEGIAAAHGGAQIRLFAKSPEKWMQVERQDASEARGLAGPGGITFGHVAEEDLLAETERMVMVLLESGELSLRPCPDPSCTCGYHELDIATEHPKGTTKRSGPSTKRNRQTPTKKKGSNDAS